MAAYVVFLRELTHTPAEFETYAQKAPQAMVGHPAVFRALYGRQEVFEGPDLEGVAIVEFPTFDEAKAWYKSSAYQDALVHRLASGDYRAILVEGFDG